MVSTLTHLLYRALSQMKVRLKGAQKGHSLLKKKADALTLRFRQILKKIIEVGVEHVPCTSTCTYKLNLERSQDL